MNNNYAVPTIGEQNIVICRLMPVCLCACVTSVCPRAYLGNYTSQFSPNLMCMLRMAVARSSSVGVAICLYVWFEQSLTPHSTQHRSFRRRSSQPITWLVLTNKIVQENTDKQTQYKSEKADNLKYSKTKLTWFNCLLQHSARKRGGLILHRPRAHTGLLCLYVRF